VAGADDDTSRNLLSVEPLDTRTDRGFGRLGNNKLLEGIGVRENDLTTTEIFGEPILAKDESLHS